MALNKAQTSLGIKIVLIVLIVAFVASFIPLIGGGFSDAGQTPQAGSGTLDTIGQQFQPTVTSLTSLLASEPESYTVLVNLGNTYFDWAIQIQQASQTDSATIGADQPLWIASKDSYRRALAVQPGEPPVTVDYAITAFYTGEPTVAIEAAKGVTETDPEFAPAYFNLGVFYNAMGDTENAISAYEAYLKLDPEGAQANADFAKQELEALKGGAATVTP